MPGLMHAQVPEQILVDTLSNSANKPLPFDRPFILNFRGANAKSINNAFILEWEVKKDIWTLKKDKRNSDQLQIDKVGVSNVLDRPKGVDINVKAQSPDKSFAILLSHHFDDDLFAEILTINFLLKTSTNAKLPGADIIAASSEADVKLKGLSKKVQEKIKPYLNVPQEYLASVTNFGFEWDNDDEVVTGFRNFFETSLKDTYLKLDKLKPISNDHNSITLANLGVIVHLADAAKLTSAELNTMVSIVTRKELPDILAGLVSSGSDFISSPTDLSKIDVRLKNLNNSLQAIEKLVQFIENIQVRSTDPAIPALITSLNQLRTDIKTNRDLLKDIFKNVKNEIDKNINLSYSTWAFGSNELWDLKTRGSYQVIPDIGIVGIYGIGNNKSDIIVRPYVGASIYLRPVDKNVPYKEFDKHYRFLHRFSFNIGLTTGKIEKGEFSDLYNGISLLTGGNYKLTRALSISGGLAFLQRKNVNPAIEDKTTTTTNPYFGLSFDLDFTNGIQKLTGKLF